MPAPESRPGQSHEHEHNTEQERGFYAEAARFPGERAAGRAYGRLQARIYAREDCDLSVYRLQLNRVYHVAVIGQAPPPDLAHGIHRILSTGEPVSLPPEVLATLVARRIEQMQHGPWSESHHRPGKRL